MTGYADVKSKKIIRLVKKLERKTGEIEVKAGGKHNIKIEHVRTGESCPLPTSHRVMNKHIVNGFMKWLVEHKVCTKEEFEKML